MIAAIDTGQIAELIWVAALAGIGFCGVFAVALLGATRSGEMRRDGRGTAAAAYGALTIVSVLAFCAAVVYGISVIVTK